MAWNVVERFEAEDGAPATEAGRSFQLLGSLIAAWQREVEVVFQALYAVLEEMQETGDD